MWAQSKRGNVHVYRLQPSYRWRLVFIYIFALIVLCFLLLGYNLNRKSITDAILIYVSILSLFGWFSWFTYQVLFGFRLEIDEYGGQLCGFGSLIGFSWHSVHAVDYVYQPLHYYQMMLFVTPHRVRHGFRWLHSFFIFKFFDSVILLDTVRKYQPFLTRGLGDTPPSHDELSLHLRYFLRTPLGQDLIAYAPHLFGDVLSKYLPDDDFDFSGAPTKD